MTDRTRDAGRARETNEDRGSTAGRTDKRSHDTDVAADARRESGEPGGGAGRREEVGPTGVYPMSAGIRGGKHLEIRNPASWGQGDRGAEGYNDAGSSELTWRDGQLLGGLSSGPASESGTDIRRGDRSEGALGVWTIVALVGIPLGAWFLTRQMRREYRSAVATRRSRQ